MPFGEGSTHSAKQTQIRLPYPDKKTVYEMYLRFFNASNVTTLETPIGYVDFCITWKSAKELQNIKCSKYKLGFSKCDICYSYKMKKSKHILTEAQKAALINATSGHIEEERSERLQYYKARTKCISNPQKGLSIIMDAMDQRKTCIPYFTNPSKAIANDFVLRTKLIGCIIHGHGTYLYWCTDQIKHDSSLSIECLRRTLLKYQHHNGSLPPKLYLQLDNGPDNKSKEFLAFLAYLVQMRVFDSIKVSYLLVGHTHEDIDQYFSCISRFIRKTLMEVYSIPEYIDALNKCFRTPGCVPKSIEQITFCYDTSSLKTFLDPHLARFDLPEKGATKCIIFYSGERLCSYELQA